MAARSVAAIALDDSIRKSGYEDTWNGSWGQHNRSSVRSVYTPDAHMDRFRADAFLPLSPVSFDVLLALMEGEQHGYRIMLDVNQRSAGTPLRAGTLYRALARLLEQELIEELTARPVEDDERRRYYRLTDRGLTVARAEAARIAAQLATARARRLVADLS